MRLHSKGEAHTVLNGGDYPVQRNDVDIWDFVGVFTDGRHSSIGNRIQDTGFSISRR